LELLATSQFYFAISRLEVSQELMLIFNQMSKGWW
jgi:hypothetical protein